MGKKSTSRDARTSPAVRVSFPTVFTPKAFQAGQDPKYGIMLMLEKNNPEHIAFLKKIHQDAGEILVEAWPDETKRPRTPLIGDIRSPIKDGDKTLDTQGRVLCEVNPEYAGHYLIRANALRKPAVVDRRNEEIIDSNEIYGGCYCKVNFNVYSYHNVSQGIACGLNGVQKINDGEAFGGGRPDVDDMFEADGADDPANYDAGDPFASQPDPLAGSNDDIPFQNDDIPF